MSVPLSDEIREHARVTTDGDARAMLEKWVEKAEGLEAGSAEPATREEHRAAGVAGLRKARGRALRVLRARAIEQLLLAKCFQRVTRLGFRDPRLN